MVILNYIASMNRIYCRGIDCCPVLTSTHMNPHARLCSSLRLLHPTWELKSYSEHEESKQDRSLSPFVMRHYCPQLMEHDPYQP